MDVERRIFEASYTTDDVIVNPFEQLLSQEVVPIEKQPPKEDGDTTLRRLTGIKNPVTFSD